MANYCNTKLTVSHPDPFKMMSFMQGIKNNNLLSKFFYKKDIRDTKWGVHWGEFELSADKLVGHGHFCTAYEPPLGAFKQFKKIGFTILAEYDCVEDDYYGSWSDGRHNHYDYNHLETQCGCFRKEESYGDSDDEDDDSEYVVIRTDEWRKLLNKYSVDQDSTHSEHVMIRSDELKTLLSGRSADRADA